MSKNKKINIKKIIVCLVIVIIIGVVIKAIVSKNKKEGVTENLPVSGNEIVNANESDNTLNEVNEVSEEKTDFSQLKDSEKLGSEGLPVLMYHFFYDKSKGEKAKDGNWIEISNFEDHLKYLTEEGYYFPSWEEVNDYIDGKTALPKKSIVLTTDDGEESFFRVALPVIKKYDVKVTNFLVTTWNGWYKNDYPAKQVSYQSHSSNMHQSGSNGKGVIQTWSYDQIFKDVSDSRQILGDECITFCYPFGHVSAVGEKAIKDAGFKMAFTTDIGRVKVGANKYELPRLRTSTATTLAVFKELIK